MARSEELLCPRCGRAALLVAAIGSSMVAARCMRCNFTMSGNLLFSFADGEAARAAAAREWARLQLKGHEKCVA